MKKLMFITILVLLNTCYAYTDSNSYSPYDNSYFPHGKTPRRFIVEINDVVEGGYWGLYYLPGVLPNGHYILTVEPNTLGVSYRWRCGQWISPDGENAIWFPDEDDLYYSCNGKIYTRAEFALLDDCNGAYPCNWDLLFELNCLDVTPEETLRALYDVPDDEYPDYHYQQGFYFHKDFGAVFEGLNWQKHGINYNRGEGIWPNIYSDGYFIVQPYLPFSKNCCGFAVLAEDWLKSQGEYRGDISGIDGTPDGYVDYYDLAALVDGWLNQ